MPLTRAGTVKGLPRAPTKTAGPDGSSGKHSDDDVAAQVASCKKLFSEHFGGQCSLVVSAPGRVNLIGEHTDYNEGFVMPFCIQRCTVLAARKIPGSECRVVSVNEGTGTIMKFPGDSTLTPCDDWTNYMRGVVAQYLPSLPGGECAFEAAVLSTVPLGGGLSSSASLEVATATLIEALYGLQVDPKEKALRCQKCEHEYCAMPCGIMDQFISARRLAESAVCPVCDAPALSAGLAPRKAQGAPGNADAPAPQLGSSRWPPEARLGPPRRGASAMHRQACGKHGHVLLIDCRPPFATEHVPLDDPSVVLLVANSNVKHKLTGSEYPDRVRQCKEACVAMRAAGHPQVVASAACSTSSTSSATSATAATSFTAASSSMT